jgi:hypothetical protein
MRFYMKFCHSHSISLSKTSLQCVSKHCLNHLTSQHTFHTYNVSLCHTTSPTHILPSQSPFPSRNRTKSAIVRTYHITDHSTSHHTLPHLSTPTHHHALIPPPLTTRARRRARRPRHHTHRIYPTSGSARLGSSAEAVGRRVEAGPGTADSVVVQGVGE